MPDTAKTLARDLIEDVGYLSAIGYMWGMVRAATTWRRASRALRLLAAVIVT